MEALLGGFATTLTLDNLFYCFVGVFLGTVVGILPGLGPLTTIAILLPITFKMDVTSAIIMLSGIYYGVAYGGTVTSVLMRIPGEASSVVTCLDGYEMARKGRAGAALGIAGIGSFFAGTVGVIGISFLSPPLAELVLKFGPAEYAMLMLAGLTMVTYMSSGSLPRALLMAAFGLLLGTIGSDPLNMTPRLTFGVAGAGRRRQSRAAGDRPVRPLRSAVHGAPEARGHEGPAAAVAPAGLPARRARRRGGRSGPVARGTVMGFLVGLLPGGGAVLASFLSYGMERKLSKHPEEFGKGAVEGLAGPESANNAGTAGAFVPLLCMGIPGQRGHGAAARRLHHPRRHAGPDHPGAPARDLLGRRRQHVYRQRHAADPEPAADRPVRAHPRHPARLSRADDPRGLPDRRLFVERQSGRRGDRGDLRLRRLRPAPPRLRSRHRHPGLRAGSDLRALGAPVAGDLGRRPDDLPAQLPVDGLRDRRGRRC